MSELGMPPFLNMNQLNNFSHRLFPRRKGRKLPDGKEYGLATTLRNEAIPAGEENDHVVTVRLQPEESIELIFSNGDGVTTGPYMEANDYTDPNVPVYVSIISNLDGTITSNPPLDANGNPNFEFGKKLTEVQQSRRIELAKVLFATARRISEISGDI